MSEQKAGYSVKEALEMIPLSEGAMYAGIANGEIPSIKIGRRLIIPAYWIKAQKEGPKTNTRTSSEAA